MRTARGGLQETEEYLRKLTAQMMEGKVNQERERACAAAAAQI